MKSSEHLEHEAAIINNWVNSCTRMHPHCSILEKTDYLPTRVIDVMADGGNSIKLTLTSEDDIGDPRYLALSHCWGTTMPLSARTTLSCLDAHRKSINREALPLSFVNFIDIARRLGIQYVWIDSLCIIQDSPSDWEQEAARMASVYSNAYITVSASGSSDGRGGCHILDDERALGPVDLEYSELEQSMYGEMEMKYRKFRVFTLSASPLSSILSTDPLNKRAWTLQERELSPRVVHYSKDSIRWECRDLKASLEFPWNDSLAFNNSQRIFDNGQLDHLTQGLKSLETLSTAEHSKALMQQRLAWFDLVDRYTNRALTRQSDILPAISGIAQAVGRSTSDQYYAGLWKSYLAQCLLWASAWSIDHGLATHSRPSTYLAPSWSWASVKGHIQYLSWMLSAHSYNPDPDPTFVPTIRGITTEPAGSDPYGMLRGGVLHIEGKIKPAFTRNDGYAIRSERQDRENVYSGQMTAVGEVRFDIPLCSDCAPPGRINILFILCCLNGKTFTDRTFRTYGIALKSINLLQRRFERVGLVWGIDPDFWKEAPVMDLTIE